VAVIGHPVAGNPTQFALECGLSYAGVDCRVLSFDVSEDRSDAALSGLAALHFTGVWVDASCRQAVRSWLHGRGESVHTADVLQLDVISSAPTFRVVEERDRIWPEMVRQDFLRVGRSIRRVLVVGEDDPRRQQVIACITGSERDGEDAHAGLLQGEQVRATANVTSSMSLQEVDCVVWLADAPESWKVLQQKLAQRQGDPVLVVDLYEGWDSSPMRWTDPTQTLLASAWIDRMTLHAELLVRATGRWFDCPIPAEVFREAIEEYLAV